MDWNGFDPLLVDPYLLSPGACATETPWNGSVPKVGKDSVVIGELQLFTRHDTE